MKCGCAKAIGCRHHWSTHWNNSVFSPLCLWCWRKEKRKTFIERRKAFIYHKHVCFSCVFFLMLVCWVFFFSSFLFGSALFYLVSHLLAAMRSLRHTSSRHMCLHHVCLEICIHILSSFLFRLQNPFICVSGRILPVFDDVSLIFFSFSICFFHAPVSIRCSFSLHISSYRS